MTDHNINLCSFKFSVNRVMRWVVRCIQQWFALLQVIDHTIPSMQKLPGKQVFRAKFSAISSVEIKAAMVLVEQP